MALTKLSTEALALVASDARFERCPADPVTAVMNAVRAAMGLEVVKAAVPTRDNVAQWRRSQMG